MGATREEMDAALKEIVLPHLRSLGFKGSLPHLHRLRGAAADLLTFQFRSDGGAFVIELGRVAAGGFNFHGRHIPLKQSKTSYLAERHRLGSELRVNYGDHWFELRSGAALAVAHQVCAELDRPELWDFIDTMAVLGEAG